MVDAGSMAGVDAGADFGGAAPRDHGIHEAIRTRTGDVLLVESAFEQVVPLVRQGQIHA